MILAPGSYTITAELSGYSFTSATVQVQTNAVSTAPRIVGYWAGAAPQATVSPAIGQYDGPQYYRGATGWVQGRVADQTGSGVPFASLNVDGWRRAYATDQQGNYRLRALSGNARNQSLQVRLWNSPQSSVRGLRGNHKSGFHRQRGGSPGERENVTENQGLCPTPSPFLCRSLLSPQL